jgi:hypothetical protein
MVTRAVSAAPCAKCPFRKDVPIYLRAGARREIVQSLLDDRHFVCHEHVDWDDDGHTDDGTECAGAAKAMLAAGGMSQQLRIAERLGLAGPDQIAARGPDVWSLDVWPLVPEGETGDTWHGDVEVETCATVNDGCLAPAGFRGAGGGVVRGSVAADGECTTCGEPLCSSCADENGDCASCSEMDDEW